MGDFAAQGFPQPKKVLKKASAAREIFPQGLKPRVDISSLRWHGSAAPSEAGVFSTLSNPSAFEDVCGGAEALAFDFYGVGRVQEEVAWGIWKEVIGN